MGDCEQCTDQLSALTDVSRVLAEVPATPLPDAVTARIDDALRAELQSRQAPPPEEDAAPPEDDIAPVVPLRRRSGPARWLPYLAAAAAAVFVIGGGTAVLREVLAPSAEETAAPLTAPQPDGPPGPDAALSYYPVVVASGTDYTADGLAAQGRVLIERAGIQNAAGADGDAAAAAPLPSPSALPSDLSACVHHIDDDGQQRPKVIDLATYEGATAWVMVFGTPSDGTGTPVEYTVRVVTPECGSLGSSDDAVVAEAVVPGH
ncbi:hypothetical protein DEF23_01365 [Marinitenerispora sediminis]|uniref:Uncharacterized protein n=1 Tax=Marinitenerispora sediminis TaxID=1931232 RepID=A0A368T243_9ACTN|nr:hypothetical protein DEF24_18370 [Marinitenerispora sediminis]RCV55453.1 hypothetical protein DEF28_05925 [Marinitenerispora sediminis]RCV61750.1 hypothetical protein DEF23_01365 [Marinitenerispora sediminis]